LIGAARPANPVRMSNGASPAEVAAPSAGPGLEVPLALAFVLLELCVGSKAPYGWFIDELYYRACSARLDWGFVDHPPASIAVLAATRAVFGDSLLASRFLPALSAAAGALTSSVLAARLGGGRFARGLATASVLSSPVVLIFGSFFSMNALELLLWPLAAIALSTAMERGGRAWLVVGALLGLAISNKHTSGAFGAALAVGTLFGPERREWRSRWPWLGVLVASTIVAPNIAWQVANGWPSLEFYRSAQLLKNIDTPPLRVLAHQVLVTGPGAAPLAVLGVAASLRDRAPGRRVLGIAFVTLLGGLALSRSSRFERLAACYPIVLAFGAVALERFARGGWRWLRPVVCIGIALSAAAFLPIALPVLRPEQAASYAATLGLVPPIEKNRTGTLPQWLADRLDWRELVADVARVYHALPPEMRGQVRWLLTPSYGEAGALELWGPSLGLPPVLSNHNSYFLWSQAALRSGTTASTENAPAWLSVGFSSQMLDAYFEHVSVLGSVRCEHCVDWRRERPIALARLPRAPLERLWPELEHFE
jgi:4-amino-4-deoxy-L-arabinose transferase-like glycosyltransferase